MSRKNKRPPTEEDPIKPTHLVEKAHFTTKTGIKKAVRIIPRNKHQEEYLEYLMDPDKIIILAHGPAGTGKSTLAMLAGIKALSEKKVSKLILCRPSVGVSDEDLGFLPGDINEKLAPWVQPLIDVLLEYYGTKDLAAMIENKVIECLPLMYMRGRNIKNAFVILDEAQNSSPAQIKALFTRLCENAKLIVTGDISQTDKKHGEDGLLSFTQLLKKFGGSKYISQLEFAHADIERHPVVKEVLQILGDI